MFNYGSATKLIPSISSESTRHFFINFRKSQDSMLTDSGYVAFWTEVRLNSFSLIAITVGCQPLALLDQKGLVSRVIRQGEVLRISLLRVKTNYWRAQEREYPAPLWVVGLRGCETDQMYQQTISTNCPSPALLDASSDLLALASNIARQTSSSVEQYV